MLQQIQIEGIFSLAERVNQIIFKKLIQVTNIC